jgi:hypothetical protein
MSNGAHLMGRIWAFFLGAALGLAGIFLDISWLVTAALIVLAGGVLLRVWAVRASRGANASPGGQAPPAPEPEP